MLPAVNLRRRPPDDAWSITVWFRPKSRTSSAVQNRQGLRLARLLLALARRARDTSEVFLAQLERPGGAILTVEAEPTPDPPREAA